MNLNGTMVLAYFVTPTGFLSYPNGGFLAPLYFDSSDCSGTPYLETDPNSAWYVTPAGIEGSIVFYSAPAGSGNVRTLNSFIEGVGSTCQAFGPSALEVSPAHQFDLSTLPLVPPFHLTD